MKWVIGGPDLPPELLQQLEDGRLVTFCGAGVSYPAGLPGFKDLVDDVYRKTGSTKTAGEEEAFGQWQFDRVLGLLENRIGAATVRKAVIERLFVDPSGNLATHQALIDLSTARDGVCRLVTTNFDRAFTLLGQGSIPIHAAPRLPVPKVGSWNSIVYLHGEISDADPRGRSLVMTSADFGLAYLTERWASRFVSDLFRRFSVLFVGYSLSDPVVRYMMDAFAADRALGEGIGTAYVLAGCAAGKEKQEAQAWKAKGVVPLLYDSKNGHSALHQTLHLWARSHKQGMLGKESMVRLFAHQTPTKPFDQAPAVSQVVWALKESSGHIAGVFARLDPLPPVEWLDVFVEYGLFALPTGSQQIEDRAGWRVPLVDNGGRTTMPPPLCPVSRQLGEWASRHLDKVEVLNWALRSGAVLNPEFRWVLRRRLEENTQTPSPLHRIWTILASEVTVMRSDIWTDSFDLHNPIKAGKWDAQLRRAVLDALSPVLELRPSMRGFMFSSAPPDEELMSTYVEAEVTPRAAESARLLFDAIGAASTKNQILADLADDATGLLKTAMNLFEMTQRADSRHDWSYIAQPSIAEHSQNSGLYHWTVLVELCRDSFAALWAVDPGGAHRQVERWRSIQYPLFRRLCMFAMATFDLYSPEASLAYLLEDNAWWLWSTNVNREKYRLLASLWPKLDDRDAAVLIDQILLGPPRSMFRDDIDNEELLRISDREIWEHLRKLQQDTRPLPEAGAARLTELQNQYPNWKIESEDKAEFPVWMKSGIGEPAVENIDEFLALPDDAVIRRLAATTQNTDDQRRWIRLVDRNPARASELLDSMAGEGIWVAEVWRAAIEAISRAQQSAVHWSTLSPALEIAPEAMLSSLVGALAWYLRELAENSHHKKEADFWAVWDRLQPIAFGDESWDSSRPLEMALNTPAGHLTQALLGAMVASKPNKCADLSRVTQNRIAKLISGEGPAFTLARVLFAARLAWLHGLHPSWVEAHFIPRFDWQGSIEEATAVWQGFSWVGHITPELWPQIKPHFLATANHVDRLDRSGEWFCHLLGAICFDRPDWLSLDEARSAVRSLDNRGRSRVARVMWKRLEGAGEKSELLWNDQIRQWVDQVWPKDLSMKDPESSLNLAMAATYANGSFSSAVDTIAPLLTGAEHSALLWERILEIGIARREPTATLKLVWLVADTTCQWPSDRLRQILVQLQEVDPGVSKQVTFRTLDEYLRAHRN